MKFRQEGKKNNTEVKWWKKKRVDDNDLKINNLIERSEEGGKTCCDEKINWWRLHNQQFFNMLKAYKFSVNENFWVRTSTLSCIKLLIKTVCVFCFAGPPLVKLQVQSVITTNSWWLLFKGRQLLVKQKYIQLLIKFGCDTFCAYSSSRWLNGQKGITNWPSLDNYKHWTQSLEGENSNSKRSGQSKFSLEFHVLPGCGCSPRSIQMKFFTEEKQNFRKRRDFTDAFLFLCVSENLRTAVVTIYTPSHVIMSIALHDNAKLHAKTTAKIVW